MLIILRRFLTHNWILKLFSLLLASLMWFAISSENNLVINHVVPLGFQGLPPNMEITHETERQVTLTLRGSASLLSELSNADITTAISLSEEDPGHKSVLLSTQHVQKPFGVEVLRIEPNRVQFDLERTLTVPLPVHANVEGTPAEGFILGAASVTPEFVEVTGPESSIGVLRSLSTLSVRIDGATESVRASVDLDIRDPLIRLPSLSPVEVHAEITEILAEATWQIPVSPILLERWAVSPEMLDVVVSGPASRIADFEPEGLSLTFEPPDGADQSEVAPSVEGLPDSFTVVTFVPETLEVSQVD